MKSLNSPLDDVKEAPSGNGDVDDFMMMAVLKSRSQNHHVGDFFNAKNLAPISQSCHQDKLSPTWM